MEYPNSLPAGSIRPGVNPRRFMDPMKFAELKASIKASGVIVPVLVRPKDDGYQLVAGYRRLAGALEEFGPEYPIPVLVKEIPDEEVNDYATVENVQRSDMSPAEEAEAAAKTLAACGGDRAEAARRLGWKSEVLNQRLGLMNCTQAVRDALVYRKIMLGHAELIATLAKERQDTVLAALLQQPKLPTVAELRAQIEQIANALSSAVFDKSDCAGCQHNSSNQQALFGESISDGYCTNRDCWNTKVEAKVQEIATGLADEYPTVKIVRPGENFAVIKLEVEGANGVGSEQAAACRGCKSFGAAVSAVPGKVGGVYRNYCFDAACNAEKVKANQAATASVEQTPPEGEGRKASDQKPAAQAKKAQQAPAKPVKVQDSQRIIDYREKVWRKALARHLGADAALSRRTLIALALTGTAGKIDRQKVGQAIQQVLGASGESQLRLNPAECMEHLIGLDDTQTGAVIDILAATAAANLDNSHLVGLLKRFAVDLSKHWTMSSEYLDLLTKSELEVVAEQVGIKAHAGDKFSKLMSGKKEDIIKKLLAVEGFDYAGKVPSHLQYD